MVLYYLMGIAAIIMLLIDPKMGAYACVLALFTAFLQYRKFKERENKQPTKSNKKRPHKKH